MSDKIFSSVKYFVTGALVDHVRLILDDGGAQKVNFFSDTVTHCIVGDHPNETDVSDAKDLFEVPAVTPYWILLSLHCRKLLPTKGFIYEPKNVFFGLRMTASGVSQADYKALWAMVTFYGGRFQSSLTPSCSHLIVSSASGSKYEEGLKHPSIKIVTPDWVVDSIKSGRKIEDNYHPRYLMVPKPKELTPPPTGDLSTSQILGFADELPLSEGGFSGPSNQALLEKLKQRMPWNQTSTGGSTLSQPTFVTQKPAIPVSSGLPSPVLSMQQSIQNPVPTQPQQMNQPSQQQQPQIQLQQSQLSQPRMMPPQMMMEQQRAMLRPQGIQGPQMKQYRIVHRGGMPPQRIEIPISEDQVTMQQSLPPQATQQQQMLQQVDPQLQQPGMLQGMQMQGSGPRQVTWAQAQGPPKQVIQLDPQTHAQLSQMDPQQKMLFLQRIHQRQVMIQQQRQMQMQQQQQQQQQQQVVQQQVQQQQVQQKPLVQQQVGQVQRQGQQTGQQVAIGGVMQMRQPQIIIRGISPQQQTAWIQQQQFIRQQQMLVQQGGQIRQAVPSGRIMQQQTATATWIPQQPEQNQQLHQIQLQRQQQLRMQQMKHQVVIQRAPAPLQQFTQVSQTTGNPLPPSLHSEELTGVDQVPGGVGGGILVNNRTKTALANMLSSRLHTGHLSPQSQVLGVTADSAAGQLRLMSAQQRAPQPPPQLAEPQKPQAAPSGVLFGTQQVAPPRRTLGNITNAAGQGVIGVQGPKSPARGPIPTANATPTVPVPPKPQFFTHNPNLRVPPEKYLIGCVFYIVEYDKSEADDVDIATWEEIIKEHGGEVETNYLPRVTHVLCETQKHGIVQQALRDMKRCVTAFWLNDVVIKGSLSVPWLALHFPVPFGKEKPLAKYNMSLTGFEDRMERDRVTLMIKTAGGQYRNYFSSATQILICKKPDGAKYRKAKELSKVTVNVHWLNEVLFGHYSCIQQPELHKYQQYNNTSIFRVDYALIPHLMAAWKIPININSEVYNAVKNSPPPARKTKKPRLDPTLEQVREMESKTLDSIPVLNIEMLSMESRPLVAITGDSNWEYAKKAKQLGCLLVRNLSKVSHLVICGKPVRSVKLLTCLITCKFVVKDSWLSDSAAKSKLLSEAPYLINSIELDDFKCNITRLISNPDRNILFKDKIFYLTPGIYPPSKVLTEMVELSGGRVEKQRRSVKAIQELNRLTPTYFVVASFDDLPLIADIFRAKLDFYSAELIMRSIAMQTFEPAASVFKN